MQAKGPGSFPASCLRMRVGYEGSGPDARTGAAAIEDLFNGYFAQPRQ